MVSSIAVCGDSFGIGHGISVNPKEIISQSFGGVVSTHYNLPLKMFARSGCCNYIIYLQVKKILEQYSLKEINLLVLITVTHHSRLCFPARDETGYVAYDLSDVDYLSYSIFPNKEDYKKFLPFKLNSYPKLISETVSNFKHFIDTDTYHFKKPFDTVKSKIPHLEKYLVHIYADSIKKMYDDALINFMHLELKEKGIPHLIMSPDTHFTRFIDAKNLFYNNWGEYTQKYPDNLGSGHCTSEGHKIVAEKLIEEITNRNLI